MLARGHGTQEEAESTSTKCDSVTPTTITRTI